MSLFLDYVRELRDDLSLFIGADQLIFAALGIGAVGAIPSCANVFPKETAMIYRYFEEGNLAESKKHQDNIGPVARAMNLGTFPSAVKEALTMIGYDCGQVRRPLVALSNSERAQVKASLKRKISRQ
jgi:4-hydroxy-tetrahydrodipicolinate synthase